MMRTGQRMFDEGIVLSSPGLAPIFPIIITGNLAVTTEWGVQTRLFLYLAPSLLAPSLLPGPG